MQRLSGLDASFLYLETPTMHMHVALVAVLDPSTMPDGYDYEVRPVAAARAVKTYRCPGCDHEIRPGGVLALFWHVFQAPPAVTTAFADAYERVVPDSPINVRASAPDPHDLYRPILDRAAAVLPGGDDAALGDAVAAADRGPVRDAGRVVGGWCRCHRASLPACAPPTRRGVRTLCAAPGGGPGVGTMSLERVAGG